MITTHDLTKRFGRVVAVEGVDLDVAEGERYGFLGPNGSGKTTTVRMLLGLVFATRGSISLLGHDVPRHVGRALPDVGSLVEAPAAYGHLPARANLELLEGAGPRSRRMGRRARRTRIDEVLDQVGLGGVGRRPVKAYSLGMRQRLGLAAAMLDRPRLLVLDEPTNGLDPQGIHEVRELLLKLNAEGTTIFVSSHLLAEVEQLCTRVGVMHRGHLVAQPTMDEVRRPTGRTFVTVDDLGRALTELYGSVASWEGDRLLVTGLPAPELNRRLVAAGIGVREMTAERSTLEDVVLSLTGPGSDRIDRTDR